MAAPLRRLTLSRGRPYPRATARGRRGGRPRQRALRVGGARSNVADVGVRLVQLTKRFGGDAQGRRVAQSVEGADPKAAFLAVVHIDLEANEGEFFSLLGPSGCGKT